MHWKSHLLSTTSFTWKICAIQVGYFVFKVEGKKKSYLCRNIFIVTCIIIVFNCSCQWGWVFFSKRISVFFATMVQITGFTRWWKLTLNLAKEKSVGPDRTIRKRKNKRKCDLNHCNNTVLNYIRRNINDHCLCSLHRLLMLIFPLVLCSPSLVLESRLWRLSHVCQYFRIEYNRYLIIIYILKKKKNKTRKQVCENCNSGVVWFQCNSNDCKGVHAISDGNNR